MIRKMLQNTRKPKGLPGRIMLLCMNTGHRPLSKWAMDQLHLAGDAHVLDVGCGGGANLAALLKRCPEGRVDGLDYSAESVAVSRKKNAQELGKRCDVTQGDVGALPFGDGTYDAATAFETVYFWPDLPRAFSELFRVLKPGGKLLIACESGDASDTTWTGRIEGMTIYSGEDLKDRLERTGFVRAQVKKTKRGWFCVAAEKPACSPSKI